MMSNNKSNQPLCRFPEFRDAGSWLEDMMQIIFNIKNGYTPSKSNPLYWEDGTIPWFRMEDIRKNGHILSDSIQHITALGVKKGGLFPAYSIIVATTATIGEHALIIVDSLANQQFTFLTKRKSFCDKIDMKYFHYFMFIVDGWCKRNTNSGGLLSVNMDSFKKLMIPYPQSLTEQHKIAGCFSTLDRMIDATKRKLELLKEHRKGLMQRLFPAKGKTVPDFRFPEFRNDTEWKEDVFSAIFNRITERNKLGCNNVLTISAQYGLVSQDEYFNKKIAASDLSNYFLIHQNDFAYNKSRSQGFPHGVIKPLKLYKEGIVSPIYLCFRIKDCVKCDNAYCEYYFETEIMNQQIGLIAQEGSRCHGLLNISTEDFFQGLMISYPPTLAEQRKIAACFLSLDKVIGDCKKRIDTLEQHRQGLMQQLFPKI